MSSGSSSPPPATVSGQASGSNNNNNDNSDGNACYHGSHNQRGGRGNINNNNNKQQYNSWSFQRKGHRPSRFYLLPNSNNDLFSKTAKEITKHVSRTIEGAGDFHLAMVNMTFPILTPPSAPVNTPDMSEPSWVDKEQYKLQYSEYI
jgi:hypothetical protein